MKIGDVVVYTNSPDKYRGVYIGKIYDNQEGIRYFETTPDASGHDIIYYQSMKHLLLSWKSI